MKKWLIPLVGLAAVVITGTAVGLAMANEGGTSQGQNLPTSENTCNPTTDINACATYVTDRVKADLATRLGIAVDDITLVSRERVEWPDSGLGVHKPGIMYSQIVTPGYKLVLSAGSHTYEYHTTLGRDKIEAAW